jgi:excinuclease ABC subunit A
MVDRILELPEKTKIMILAPIVRDRKGEYKKEMQDLQKKDSNAFILMGKFTPLKKRQPLIKKQNTQSLWLLIV